MVDISYHILDGSNAAVPQHQYRYHRCIPRYVKLPQIIDFTDKDGNDRMQEEIQANYDRIRQEVRQIVEDEITRIKNDPELCHLIKEEE